MVGQDEALAGYHLAGAEPAEMNDRILQTALVDAVNVLGSELHAHFLHFRLVELGE